MSINQHGWLITVARPWRCFGVLASQTIYTFRYFAPVVSSNTPRYLHGKCHASVCLFLTYTRSRRYTFKGRIIWCWFDTVDYGVDTLIFTCCAIAWLLFCLSVSRCYCLYNVFIFDATIGTGMNMKLTFMFNHLYQHKFCNNGNMI